MGKIKPNPRYNIVTTRVDDITKAKMDALKQKKKLSVSEITNMALDLFFKTCSA